MAHLAEKSALGAIGRARLVGGLCQLDRALVDALFEVIVVALELEVQPDARAQHLLVDRLVDKVHGPAGQRQRLAGRRGVGRHEDHRDVARQDTLLERCAHRVAVHARHHHVEQDQVGFVASQQLERLRPGSRHAQFVGPAEQRHQCGDVRWLVIDDQDRRAGSLACAHAQSL